MPSRSAAGSRAGTEACGARARRPKPVGLPERGWVFWLWVLMDHIKFWILSALLSLFGYTVYAQKLWTGWTVRSPPEPVAPALLRLVAAAAAPPCPLLWRRPGGATPPVWEMRLVGGGR